MTRARILARTVWSAGFLIGAFNHGREIAWGGWMPYGFAPDWANLFWTLLLPIDLAAVLFIWWRPVIGVPFGISIMVADVAINSSLFDSLGLTGLSFALQGQTLFLGFVLGAAPFLLRREQQG